MHAKAYDRSRFIERRRSTLSAAVRDERCRHDEMVGSFALEKYGCEEARTRVLKRFREGGSENEGGRDRTNRFKRCT